MRALVYHGPGRKAWEEVPDPEITDEGDATVRVDATTICGTDLHSLAGDVPDEARLIPAEILNEFDKAYEVFGNPAAGAVLKVMLTRGEGDEDQ